jgi:hypothetical protein
VRLRCPCINGRVLVCIYSRDNDAEAIQASSSNIFKARTVANWKDGNVSGFAIWGR